MKKPKPTTCPKCRRVQYFVCSNRKCSCWQKVPRGLRPQRWARDGECVCCAYCGFKAHIDYWFERDMKNWRPESAGIAPSAAPSQPKDV
jgi:hypothetical protein